MPDWSHLTRREILYRCRARRWTGCSQLRKSELLRFVHRQMRQHAASVIQRAVRRWRKANQVEVVNHQDIFTMDDFGADTPMFRLFVRQFKVYQFDCRSLLQYVWTTGLFHNPFTRQPLTDRELQRLQTAYFQHCPSDQSIVVEMPGGRRIALTAHTDIVQCRSEIRIAQAERHQREELESYLVNKLFESLDRILHIVEGFQLDDNMHTAIMSVNDGLVDVVDDITVLRQFDVDVARTAMISMLQQIRSMLTRLAGCNVRYTIGKTVYKTILAYQEIVSGLGLH